MTEGDRFCWANIGTRWAEETAHPDWSGRVAQAVSCLVDSGAFTGLRVSVESIRAVAAGGVVYLEIVYRQSRAHPHPEDFGGRMGLRRSLAFPPAIGADVEEEDLALWLARWVVNFELAEPMGTRVNNLVKDENGVMWWSVTGVSGDEDKSAVGCEN